MFQITDLVVRIQRIGRLHKNSLSGGGFVQNESSHPTLMLSKNWNYQSAFTNGWQCPLWHPLLLDGMTIRLINKPPHFALLIAKPFTNPAQLLTCRIFYLRVI